MEPKKGFATIMEKTTAYHTLKIKVVEWEHSENNGIIHETAERHIYKKSKRPFQNRNALNYGRGDLDGHDDRGGRG